MRRTTEQVIESMVATGYRKASTGYGKYDEELKSYRNDGFLAAAWYIPSDNSELKYVIYIKEKAKRTAPKPATKPIEIESLKLVELKKLCQQLSISKYYKLNKSQMIEALKSKMYA